QIVDFLNAHMIQYALMVNPTIYVSCIKHFWTSVSIKKSNDAVRLQALIDRKKVIIIEDTVRQALCLDDATGIDCLPNEEIFAELARMGYEKPSSMASAVICLATSRKFDFSKYIFDSMAVKDAAEDENDVNKVSAEPTPPSPTPAIPSPSPTQEHIPSPPQAQTAQPSPSPPPQSSQTTDTSMTLLNTLLETWGIAELNADEDVTQVDAEEDVSADVQGRVAESQAKVYHLDLEYAEKVLRGIAELDADEDVTQVDAEEDVILSMQDTDEAEPAKEEVVEVVTATKLMTEQVKRREKQDNTIIRYQALKRKHVTEAQARKNMMIYLKNMAGFKMDFFKGMTYNEIRPIFEKHYNLNQAFLERVEEEVIGQKEEEGSKRKVENLKQRADKKQRIDEETEELKTHLQIVANDNDDYVYIEATPLALKFPIVDYQIHHEHNKPYYKIIRADGTHQLFLSFITLLKNFDIEDLEIL
nr:hypothetical protein [Tanacetum cinerariifolium]